MSRGGELDSGGEARIPIGEDGSGKEISFQQAQDFYNEITGKSEQMTEAVRSAFILKFADVENLCHRINQTTEQYNVTSAQCSFTVRYIGDSSERFSSLDRLRLHAGTGSKPIEALILEWRLLVVLPKTHRAQEYKIHLNISSRVARAEEARKQFEDAPFSFPFHQLDRIETASISIDFVDYSVAQSMMTTVLSWFEGLRTAQTNKVLNVLRRKSFRWPSIISGAFIAFSAAHVALYSGSFFSQEVNQQRVSLFILASVLYVYIARKCGRFLGGVVEKNLNKLISNSYINFSEADRRLVEESDRRNKKHLWTSIGSLVLSVAIALFSSAVVKFFMG